MIISYLRYVVMVLVPDLTKTNVRSNPKQNNFIFIQFGNEKLFRLNKNIVQENRCLVVVILISVKKC